MALFDGFTLPPTKGTEQYRAPDDPRGGKPDLGSDMKQDTGLPSWMQEEVFGPKGGGSGGAGGMQQEEITEPPPAEARGLQVERGFGPGMAPPIYWNEEDAEAGLKWPTEHESDFFGAGPTSPPDDSEGVEDDEWVSPNWGQGKEEFPLSQGWLGPESATGPALEWWEKAFGGEEPFWTEEEYRDYRTLLELGKFTDWPLQALDIQHYEAFLGSSAEDFKEKFDLADINFRKYGWGPRATFAPDPYARTGWGMDLQFRHGAPEDRYSWMEQKLRGTQLSGFGVQEDVPQYIQEGTMLEQEHFESGRSNVLAHVTNPDLVSAVADVPIVPDWGASWSGESTGAFAQSVRATGGPDSGDITGLSAKRWGGPAPPHIWFDPYFRGQDTFVGKKYGMGPEEWAINIGEHETMHALQDAATRQGLFDIRGNKAAETSFIGLVNQIWPGTIDNAFEPGDAWLAEPTGGMVYQLGDYAKEISSLSNPELDEEWVVWRAEQMGVPPGLQFRDEMQQWKERKLSDVIHEMWAELGRGGPDQIPENLLWAYPFFTPADPSGLGRNR